MLTSNIFQVVEEVGGDVDAAIEFLVAEQGAEEAVAANDSHTCHANGSHGNGQSLHRLFLDIWLGFSLHYFFILFL